MNLSTLFAKPVDRPIEGVIKADDRRHLEVEVEEFVREDSTQHLKD